MSNVVLMASLLGIMSGTPSVDQLADSTCQVSTETGISPAEADAESALAACQTARESFAELFGDPAPEVQIILWEEAHYRMGLLRGEATIFWPSSDAMRPNTSDSTAASEHLAAQWREVLPHEIAHLLLAVRYFPEAGATPADGYGTPFPDWLDEAAAIWAEPPASRRRRVDQARELPAEYLDLRSILSRSHPATGRSAAYIARDGTAHPADFTLWAFYPQAIAVLEFIHEAGGSQATQELARRLQEDPDNPEPLTGLPGLPDDFEAIEALWEEWLARGPAGEEHDD